MSCGEQLGNLDPEGGELWGELQRCEGKTRVVTAIHSEEGLGGDSQCLVGVFVLILVGCHCSEKQLKTCNIKHFADT